MTLLELVQNTDTVFNLFDKQGNFINAFWFWNDELATEYMGLTVVGCRAIARDTMNIIIDMVTE